MTDPICPGPCFYCGTITYGWTCRACQSPRPARPHPRSSLQSRRVPSRLDPTQAPDHPAPRQDRVA
jgi:hypothetical protein